MAMRSLTVVSPLPWPRSAELARYSLRVAAAAFTSLRSMSWARRSWILSVCLSLAASLLLPHASLASIRTSSSTTPACATGSASRTSFASSSATESLAPNTASITEGSGASYSVASASTVNEAPPVVWLTCTSGTAAPALLLLIGATRHANSDATSAVTGMPSGDHRLRAPIARRGDDQPRRTTSLAYLPRRRWGRAARRAQQQRAGEGCGRRGCSPDLRS
mmetsp:Transcript_11463/g.35396  ORF Transcript_11463/g.35396 Transcript_11463/m.35396 type:complete len:221 (-) Transcript_11463:17-679(-)